MVFYGTFRFGICTIQYFLILVLVLFGILWYFQISVVVLFGILWYFQISVVVLFGILWYFSDFCIGTTVKPRLFEVQGTAVILRIIGSSNDRKREFSDIFGKAQILS